MFQGNKFPRMLRVIIITHRSCVQTEPFRTFLEPDESAVTTTAKVFPFLFLSPHFSSEPVRVSSYSKQFASMSPRASP